MTGGAPPPGNPFLERLVARRAGDAPFATLHGPAGWEDFGFAALFDQALQVAGLLRGQGVPPGGLVFIMLRHGRAPYAGFLGAMLAGAVPSFLPPPTPKQDPELFWRQHRALLLLTQPAAILAEPDLHGPVRAVLGEATPPLLRPEDAAAHPPELPARLPDASAVALLQHSSGTTGLKKGVALSYLAITRQLEAYAARLGLAAGGGARVASWLPLYHDMGLVTGFLLPLWLGLPVVAMDPFVWVARPALLAEAVQRFRASHVWLPNFAFHLLARAVRDAAGLDLGSVVAWTNCSEPCRAEAFAAFLDRFGPAGVRPEALSTCYAMAETVFAVSQPLPGSPVRVLSADRATIETERRIIPPAGEAGAVRLLSNGPPVAGCEVAVRGADGFLPPGHIGELWVRAPFLFEGYNRNPAASAEAFAGGWYRSGDLGFLDGGEVFVTGRIKDLVIVAGKNIHAYDVEAALAGLAGLRPGRAVAFGHDNAALGTERLVVVAEAEPGADEMALTRAINGAVLDAVGLPCGDIRLVPAGWLVKTTSGKVSREANARKYAAMRGPHP